MGPPWRRVFLASLLLLGLLSGVFSDDIGGSYYGNHTLSLSGSPYDVTRDINVYESATLTIEAGVRLLFPEGVGMTVRGRLIAAGTPEHRIVFERKTNPPGDQGSTVTRDPDIRLLGPTVFEGRVQVKRDGEWGSLCLQDSWWRNQEATVVCRQLGFATGRVENKYRFGRGRMAVGNLRCTGNEDNIYDCSHDSLDLPPRCLQGQNRRDLGVVCEGLNHRENVYWKAIDIRTTNQAMRSTLENVDLFHAGDRGGNQNEERAAIISRSVPPLLRSVHIRYSEDAAIRVDNPTAPFYMEHCDISENQGAGLIVTNPSSNVTIVSTTFSKNFPVGMQVIGGHTGSNLRITDSTFEQNSGAGLMLSDVPMNVDIRQSNFSTNSHYGLSVFTTTQVSLVTDSCLFDHNGLDGFHARYLGVSGDRSRTVFRNGGARGNDGSGFDLEIEYQEYQSITSPPVSDQIIIDQYDFASNENGSVKITVDDSYEDRFPVVHLTGGVYQDNLATVIEVGGTRAEVTIQDNEFGSSQCGSKSVIHVHGYDKTVNITGNRFFDNVCRRVMLFNTTDVSADLNSLFVEGNTFENNEHEAWSLADMPSPMSEYCTIEIVGTGQAHTITRNSFLNSPSGLELCSGDGSHPFAANQIRAENNWWGTTDSNAIQEKIFDNNDQYIRVGIEFSPYLDSPSGSPMNAENTEGTETMTASSLGGRLNGTLRLTASDSPVTLTRDLTILPDSVLTVEAGVEIHVQGRVGILNLGKLQLDGQPSSPITFTASRKLLSNRTIPVRLTGGSSFWEGQLEVLYSGRWVPVCYDWYSEFANIACQQLGLGFYKSATYGYDYSDRNRLTVRCDGSEDNIGDCSLYRTSRCRTGSWYSHLKLTCDSTPGWGGIVSLSNQTFEPQNVNLFHVGHLHAHEASGIITHGSSASSIMNNVVIEESIGSPSGIQFLDLQPSQHITIQNVTVINSGSRDGTGIGINDILSLPWWELEVNIAKRLVSFDTMCGGPTSLVLQEGQPLWIVNGIEKRARLRCHKTVEAPDGCHIRVTVTKTDFSYPSSRNSLTIYESFTSNETEMGSFHYGNEVSQSGNPRVFTSNGSTVTLLLQASTSQNAFFLAKFDTIKKGDTSAGLETPASLEVINVTARNFQYGVHVSSEVTNVRIDGVTLSHCAKGLYIQGVAEGHVSVESTVALQNLEDGIHISFIIGSVMLSNVSVVNNTNNGIYINDITGTVNMSDVVSHSNYEHGIYISIITGGVDMSEIVSHTNSDHGIYLGNVTNVNIGSTTVSSCAKGLFVQGSDGNISVESTVANFNSEEGVHISSCLGGITLLNVSVVDNSDHGMYFNDITDTVNMSDVVAHTNNGHGIYMSDVTSVYIDRGTISSCAKGLYVERAGEGLISVESTVVIQNSQEDNSDHGIEFNHITGTVNMSDVGSHSNRNHGIYLSDVTSVYVERSMVSSCTKGLYVQGAAKGHITVDSTVAVQNSEEGVYISSSLGSVTVSNVSVVNSSSHGMYFNDITGTVDMSDIGSHSNNGHGIYLRDVTNAHIGMSTISSCTKGLYVQGLQKEGHISVESAVAVQNSDTGIDISSLVGSVTLSNVSAVDNSNRGIYIYDITGAVDMNGIVSHSNYDYGIYIYHITGTVDMNDTISHSNSDHGIYLLNIRGNALLTGVVSSGNGANDAGITIYHSSSHQGQYKMVNVTCQDSRGKGLDINIPSEARVEMHSSRVQGNDHGGIYAKFGSTQPSQNPGIILQNSEIHNNKRFALHVTGKQTLIVIANSTISNNSCPYQPAVGFEGETKDVNLTNSLLVGNNARETLSFLFGDYSDEFSSRNIHVIGNVFNGNIYNPSQTDGTFLYSQYPDHTSCTIEIGGYVTYCHLSHNMLDNPDMNYTMCSRISTTSPDETIDARYNWWGTVVDNEIRDRISDFGHWSDRAPVDYFPYLTGPDVSSPLADLSNRDITKENTNIRGRIHRSLHLRKDGGPYTINGDLTVLKNASLTIDPGSTFKVHPCVGLWNLGSLVAQGTRSEPISFDLADVPLHQPQVRLVGGRFPWEGRVEVFYNGTWGTVCGRYWNSQDSNVICRELSYEKCLVCKTYSFGSGAGPIWIGGYNSRVDCVGHERSIFNCLLAAPGNTNIFCTHSWDVGVRCTPNSAISTRPLCTTRRWGGIKLNGNDYSKVKHIVIKNTGSLHGLASPGLTVGASEEVVDVSSIHISECEGIGLKVVGGKRSTAITDVTVHQCSGDTGISIFGRKSHMVASQTSFVESSFLIGSFNMKPNVPSVTSDECGRPVTIVADKGIITSPNYVVSSSREVFVTFRTDSMFTREGFELEFSSTESEDIDDEGLCPCTYSIQDSTFRNNSGSFINITAITDATIDIQRSIFSQSQARGENDTDGVCDNNLFYDNIGMMPGEKYTIVVSANDAELATSHRTPFHPVNATHNWWGVDSRNLIETRIRDRKDRDQWAEVLFEPWTPEAPSNEPCDLGWTYSKPLSACYRYMGGSQTWDDAVKSCQVQLSILVRRFAGLERTTLDNLLASREEDFLPGIPVWIERGVADNCKTYHPTFTGALQTVACASHYPFFCKIPLAVVTVEACPNSCSHHGSCEGQTCVCQRGWEKHDCSQYNCRERNDCGEYGTCVGPNICRCRNGWQGRACTVSYCNRFTSCKSCTREVGCGWCEERQSCESGLYRGPDVFPCKSWFYHGCFTVGQRNRCSENIEIVDCESKQCNKALSSTTVESCLRCQDMEACFRTSNEDYCNVWNEDRCPKGFIHPLYNDTTRIEKILIAHNVKYVPSKDNILYRCPVRLSSRGANMFVNEGDLDIQFDQVLSSPQANGVLHKVERVTKTDSYTVMVAHPAALEDMLDYSDFSQEVQLEAAVDMRRNEGAPELSEVERVLKGNGTLDGSTVHIITEDTAVYKCIGDRATNKGVGRYHLLMRDTPNHLSVGDVIVSNHSNGILEQVIRQKTTPYGVFIQTELQDCFTTFNSNFSEELKTTDGESLPASLPCPGGPDGTDGLLVVESGRKEVDLEAGDVVVGRRSGRLLAKVMKITTVAGYKLLEVEPVLSRTKITPPARSRRRRDDATIGIAPIRTPLNLSIEDSFSITTDGYSIELSTRGGLSAGIKLSLVVSTSEFRTPTLKKAGAFFIGGRLEMGLEGSLDVSESTQARDGFWTELSPRYVSLCVSSTLCIPAKLWGHIVTSYEIYAEGPGSIQMSSTVVKPDIDGGGSWQPQEGGQWFSFDENEESESADITISSYSGAVNESNQLISLELKVRPTFFLEFPTSGESEEETNKIQSIEDALGYISHSDAFGYTTSIQSQAVLRVAAQSCSTDCPYSDRPQYVGVTSALDYLRGAFNVIVGNKEYYQEHEWRREEWMDSDRECKAQPSSIDTCRDICLSCPGGLLIGRPHPINESFCMCPCNCGSGNISFTHPDISGGGCNCDVCPDGEFKTINNQGHLHCPCLCPDNRISVLTSDGTCDNTKQRIPYHPRCQPDAGRIARRPEGHPIRGRAGTEGDAEYTCSCTCPDGSRDVVLSDGSCPCRCTCNNCHESVLGPQGCICSDSCPDCENDEEPEWQDCVCKCPQKTECGIPPTCVVGRMGPDCRQPDCRPCQGCSGNGQCTTSTDSCQSSCVCPPQWFGDCCELRRPRPIGGDPHLQTLDVADFPEVGNVMTSGVHQKWREDGISHHHCSEREVKEATSLLQFKQRCRAHMLSSRHHQGYRRLGDCRSNILATRLRIGWCQLNSTLAKFNLTGRGCACGATSETVTHFLLHCPLHAAARQDLTTAVYRLVRRPLSTSVLLNGSPGNDITLNESLSHSFHTYITSTNRISYDYHGIGEFWDCKSVSNDFGVQTRMYAYESASLIGGFAVKTGHSVVTLMTLPNATENDVPNI
ncbi:hypothetical protein Bbelb_159400, partial [Branchiostoma belcheri]